MDNNTLSKIKEKVKTLPLKPGVYIMLDEDGGVLYVGKARQLKSRVSQYFQDSQSHSGKTLSMVSQVFDFDYIIAGSELEALVLECSLIKRHNPKYNILLKDAKGYPFIRIDLRVPYPKFTMQAKLKNDGARYFGPYGGRQTTRKIIGALGSALKLPDCERVFPRDIGKARPCLNFHMERCMAPCTGNFTEADHRALILQAVSLLDGKYDQVLREIRSEMEQAAEKLEFEQAAALRDRMNAISALGQKQHVVSGMMADTDVVGFYDGTKKAVSVLHYISGMLLDKDVEVLDQAIEEEISEILDAYVTQYYAGRSAVPGVILLPAEIENRESLEQMLTESSGHKVTILVPKRGEKLELTLLANQNAREEAERLTTRTDRNLKNLTLLQKMLGLAEPPERIEAYDISNLGSSDIVASMTVFVGGKPEKKDYRRFKIEGTDGPDDYASMAEVLTRRFKRFLERDEKFAEQPDLLLIDGGETHARTALAAIEALGIQIPVFGMVKDGRHRTKALVSPAGEEIAVSATPGLFAFIGRIQEETHRFAIEYSRSLRKKRIYGSELDKIEGVGPVRRAELLKKFKSIKKIREAGVEELAEVVPRSVAESIRQYFGG